MILEQFDTFNCSFRYVIRAGGSVGSVGFVGSSLQAFYQIRSFSYCILRDFLAIFKVSLILLIEDKFLCVVLSAMVIEEV